MLRQPARLGDRGARKRQRWSDRRLAVVEWTLMRAPRRTAVGPKPKFDSLQSGRSPPAQVAAATIYSVLSAYCSEIGTGRRELLCVEPCSVWRKG